MRNHIRKLFFSGFRHYLKANLWVALGVAISTAVLTGGLIVGDSVKHSLEQSVIARLGNVSHALTSGERYFTGELEHRLTQQGIATSAALRLEGMASANGGQMRLNDIQVWGLNNQFQNVVAPAPTLLGSSSKNSSAFISENTAVRLNLSEGDQFLLRIEKGSLLPANAPFVSSENQSSTAQFTVAGIIGSEEMGRLNLRNSQTAPFNVFIPIERLNQLSEMQGRANVLFINSEMNDNDLSRIISNNWTLEDTGLSVIEAAADNKWELRSARVFMDDAIMHLVRNSGFDYTPILTYFANELSLNDKTTPYSFVSTLPDEELLPGEAVINSWLANDIDANIGDSLTIGYFEIGSLRELNEAERNYKIVRIEEIDGFFGDRLLMPEIPGLSDSESCRDWDTGVPVDLKAIRDKDEDYWYQYRGVPKAFIAYSQGAGLWGNRFGNATAYRFRQSDVALEELEERLLSQIDPFAFDIQLRNVRREGLTAARQGTDFSSLFIGLSFFILVSGILLTALLFVFNLEKRRSEIGTLTAIGFNKKTVIKLFMFEGLAISVVGGILGIGLAMLYNELVFIALNRVWNSIVRTDVLVSHYKSTTLLIGFALSVFISLASIFIVLHRALKRNIIQLQRRQQLKPGKYTSIIEKYASISLFILGFAIIIFQLSSPGQINASYFFMAGGLFLFAAVLGASSFLRKKPELNAGKVNTAKLILQNLRQSRNLSLLVIILLAIGTYLVVSTGMNRKDFYAQSNDKSSGTGGFLYWIESTVPVLHNLNDESYRNEQAFFEDFEAVHFHVAEGDDASCLNLNRISNPRILGVNSEQLNNRFSFQTKMSDLKNKNDLWPQLKADFGDCIPAIADQTVIQWSLGKKAGDTLVYQNALGNEVKLILIGGLAASVFQGNVIIDNSYFMEHFPTISGSNVFLIDGDQSRAEPIAEELDLAYRDLGWDMQLTAERLAMFNSIERTYLSIFLVLGALGLLIGTIGLAIVLQRTLLERKAEFSALSALGFKRKSIRRMVVAEFSILLTAGIAAGTISALISVFPSLSGSIDNISVGFVLTLMAIIVANGLLWIIFLAGYQIKRLNIVESLRNE